MPKDLTIFALLHGGNNLSRADFGSAENSPADFSHRIVSLSDRWLEGPDGGRAVEEGQHADDHSSPGGRLSGN